MELIELHVLLEQQTRIQAPQLQVHVWRAQPATTVRALLVPLVQDVRWVPFVQTQLWLQTLLLVLMADIPSQTVQQLVQIVQLAIIALIQSILQFFVRRAHTLREMVHILPARYVVPDTTQQVMALFRAHHVRLAITVMASIELHAPLEHTTQQH